MPEFGQITSTKTVLNMSHIFVWNMCLDFFCLAFARNRAKNTVTSVCNLRICLNSVNFLPPKLFEIFVTYFSEICSLLRFVWRLPKMSEIPSTKTVLNISHIFVSSSSTQTCVACARYRSNFVHPYTVIEFDLCAWQHCIVLNILYFSFFCRWCVCMDHEDFEKLCSLAFRIIAATHKENCSCECSFCDICHTLTYISISWLMEHLLCPGARRFPMSSFKLYDWACIYNQ